MTRNTAIPWAVATVAAALALSACSTDSSDTPMPQAEPTAASSVDATDAPATTASAQMGDHVGVEAFAEVASAPDTVVLDVRTPEEVAQGHLPGATFADIAAPDFADQLAGLDRDATYAVYCRSGNRSRAALEIMEQMGFTDVTGLDGGIVDWVNHGGVVVIP